MRVLSWVKRILVGLRDRLIWILTGVFGPPLGALRRVVLALRDRFDAIIATFLEWTSNFGSPIPKDAKERLGVPSLACPMLAAGVLALVLYTWPSWDVLSPVWFYLATAVVWIVSWVVLRTLSFPDKEGRFSAWLREAARRPGLFWWEIVGFALALLGTALAWTTPHLRPLTWAILFGFLRFMITKKELRELVRLRDAPLEPPPPLDETDDGDGADVVRRDFSWTLHAGVLADDHDLTVPVRVSTYQRLRQGNPRTRWRDGEPLFNEWIVDGSTEEVDRAAYALSEISRQRGYSTFAEISNVLAFVQAVPYSLDEDSTGTEDYWRYPVETVYDQTGDCEDTTILAAAVLRRLGHRVGTLLLPEHAALAVEAPPGTPGAFVLHEGRAMYYCETTASGWRVGEVPAHLRDAEVEIHMVPE